MFRAAVVCTALIVAATAAPASAARKAKGPVVLEVTASIKGAEIYIDGAKVGEAPYKSRTLTPGTHAVAVKKLGHLEYVEQVEIVAGKAARVFADLLPFAGVISVKSDAKGTQVLVDGTLVGTAPLTVEVKIGPRTITLRPPGKKEYTTEIRAEPGQVYPIDPRAPANAALPALEGMGGQSDPSMDLALEPVAGSSQPHGDVALELPALGADLTAIPGQGPTGARAVIDGRRPWYKQWWVWTAAGVVITGGLAAVMLSRGGDEATDRTVDRDWSVFAQ